jgi:hypothetical protein
MPPVFALLETHETEETHSSAIIGIFSSYDKGDFFLDTYANKMYSNPLPHKEGYLIKVSDGEIYLRVAEFEVK